MSIKNSIKFFMLASAASMLPGIATAANPTFGAWSATDGTGITGCPTGFTCEVVNSGDGFQQATVTEDADTTNTFLWTVVTDIASGCNDAASCAFSDENFVKTDGTSTGITDKQSINDVPLNFSGSVEINSGFADTAGVPSVNISQDLTDNGAAGTGDEFHTAFGLQVDLDSNGIQTGKSMAITQDVGLGVGSGDTQSLDVREVSGTAQTQSGSAALGGGTVNWTSGDDVLLTWIDQNVDIGSTGSSLFAFQAVENKGPSEVGVVSDFSTTANDPTSAPFDWAPGSDVEATFGTP